MWRRHQTVPIAAFLVWATLVGAGLLAATVRGGIEPMDYRTYHRAATALARGAARASRARGRLARRWY